MGNGLGDRIKEIRGDIPQKDFGAKFGVNINTMGRYESGINFPKADFIIALCEEYNINPSWLLFGTGDKGVSLKLETSITNFQSARQNLEFDLIPMVETKLSAGGGAFVVSEKIEGYYAFKKSWVRSVSGGAKDLVLMRVDGDSMAPTIIDGDTVMIDSGRKDVKEGHLYAIRLDSTVMVKRLSFRPGGKILVSSDNRAEYDPYEVNQVDLHIIGQVIFFSRVLIRE